jgi:hypothetical protein
MYACPVIGSFVFAMFAGVAVAAARYADSSTESCASAGADAAAGTDVFGSADAFDAGPWGTGTEATAAVRESAEATKSIDAEPLSECRVHWRVVRRLLPACLKLVESSAIECFGTPFTAGVRLRRHSRLVMLTICVQERQRVSSHPVVSLGAFLQRVVSRHKSQSFFSKPLAPLNI